MISGKALKAIVVLALVLGALFDTTAVVVNAMQLDDIAGDTLRVARQTWATTGRAAAVEDAVAARVEREENVALDGLEVGREEIVLTVSRPSRTLLAHRIPPLEPRVHRSATKQAPLP